MARLTKVQTYAILWLDHKDETVSSIANQLGLTEKQVKSIIEKNHATTNEPSNNAIKTVKSSVSKSKDLMITQTSNKGTKNVAIMTQEASQLNDSLRSTMTRQNRTSNNSIYRPNG